MKAPPFTARSLLSPWWNGVVGPLISDSSEKMLYCSGKQPPHIPSPLFSSRLFGLCCNLRSVV